MIIKLLARPLLSAPFIVDGIDAFRYPEKHADRVQRVEPYLTKLGLPPALTADSELLARITGGVSALAGFALATGRKSRLAALTLATIHVPITLANTLARSEDDESSLSRLVRNGALVGGLLYAAEDRGGKPSLAWRMGNYREHRAELKEAKQKVKDRYTD
ncbi:MAG: DoxX family protein [Bowdeniella nasicola]|nr:DoxX family protein [Bowdeniella nasicola]